MKDINFDPSEEWFLAEELELEEYEKFPHFADQDELKFARVVKMPGLEQGNPVEVKAILEELAKRIVVFSPAGANEINIDGKDYWLIHKDNPRGSFIAE